MIFVGIHGIVWQTRTVLNFVIYFSEDVLVLMHILSFIIELLKNSLGFVQMKNDCELDFLHSIKN